MIVATKKQSYDLAASGAFGNVIERFFSLDAWLPRAHEFASWGVQTTKVPGGPCRLNCPTAEVAETFRSFQGFGPVVSAMISACVPTVWCGDVWDGPEGSSCHGLLRPPLGFNWRKEMLHPREWKFSAARTLLRAVLNDNSYSDLEELIETYPNQIYEISAFDRCVGPIKGRNHLVWEVRAY